MSDINKKIIELINENKSMREISNILGISEKQLYVRIKQVINYGYNLKPHYNYNADINYEIVKNKLYEKDNYIKIAMTNKENKFKCLVFSDLHLGDIDSNIKLLDSVYNYATNNNIKYILNCGDNIENIYTTGKKIIKDINEQIEYFVKKYPYDKNIKNIMIFGNHDYYSLKNEGLDLSKKIKNSRYDLIPIGFGQGTVNIKNDNLILFHKLNEDYKLKKEHDEKLILSGHGHMMKTKLKDELWLCIPTLSNVSTDKTKDIIPGFVELNIDLENGKFEYMEAKHLIITPKVIQASESRCRIKNLNKLK